MGTEALVARAQAGDPAALAEIYGEYADRLYDLCFGILRNGDAAADAVQDTFVLVADATRNSGYDRPVDDDSVDDGSATHGSAADRSAAHGSAADRPAADRPAADRPAADRPAGRGVARR